MSLSGFLESAKDKNSVNPLAQSFGVRLQLFGFFNVKMLSNTRRVSKAARHIIDHEYLTSIWGEDFIKPYSLSSIFQMIFYYENLFPKKTGEQLEIALREDLNFHRASLLLKWPAFKTKIPESLKPELQKTINEAAKVINRKPPSSNSSSMREKDQPVSKTKTCSMM